MKRQLAALLALFMANHRQCVGEFDTIVPVPSATRTAVMPIIGLVPLLADVFEPALTVAEDTSARQLSPDRFKLSRSVFGERILLLDDTFTTGASLFSSAAALRGGGAKVTTLVLGRHVNPGFGPSEIMLEWLADRPWNEGHCVRCGGEYSDPDTLPWGW